MAEENNIKQAWYLSFLSIVLALSIWIVPRLPQFLSYQDYINPERLSEYYNPYAKVAIFNNKTIPISTVEPQVLGETISLPDSSSRHIKVDLTTQQLTAYENDQKIYSYPISSGTWNRTPNGTFTVWAKVRSQKMSGGSKELGTYYYLPNVPHVLFFYNDKTPKKMGYSIHGAYWHNNFGTPMSHGCINMKTSEVGSIYDWAQVGTNITITGKYQGSLANK